MKYAIIETGGKQYKVCEGEKVKLEKIPAGTEGQSIQFTRVLFVRQDSDYQVGAPLLENAKVDGEILVNDKDKKILVLKKKRRKGYMKKYGHRQPFTEVLIKSISI